MSNKPVLKQGDLCLFNFDPGVGHEFQGKRPALVVQADAQIRKSSLITVLPLTSNINSRRDDDIILHPDVNNNLYLESVIKVYDVMSVDYERFINKIGFSSVEILQSVKNYLKKHFDL